MNRVQIKEETALLLLDDLAELREPTLCSGDSRTGTACQGKFVQNFQLSDGLPLLCKELEWDAKKSQTTYWLFYEGR
jgi:hypothetical protein